MISFLLSMRLRKNKDVETRGDIYLFCFNDNKCHQNGRKDTITIRAMKKFK